MPGGTAFYFAHAICNLDPAAKFELITAVGKSEMQTVSELQARGISVRALPSRHSVFSKPLWRKSKQPHATGACQSRPVYAKMLENAEADIFHLGSLLADDFSIDVFEMLSAKGTLSVDAQGYLREVRGEKVYSIDWKNKRDYLKYVDILKVNEFEIESLTGSADTRTAALRLAEWGVKETCITLGSYGSVIFDRNTFYDIPAYPIRKIVDATGCGDTYSAGYLYMRANDAPIEDSGCFAAAMSSLKLAHSGPFNGTATDIRRLIADSGLSAEIHSA